jgi:hypothetical protein
MISKPFLQRMAILALKKMTSYASNGRKKSYQIELMILLGNGSGVTGYAYPVDTEPLRAGSLQTKSRTDKHWNLRVLVCLANNRFKYAEDAVQLVHSVRSA